MKTTEQIIALAADIDQQDERIRTSDRIDPTIYQQSLHLVEQMTNLLGRYLGELTDYEGAA
tara:strand:- start:3252 stop:3434 length:183 start_codon:yes stop_codon:yes gene_type:complete